MSQPLDTIVVTGAAGFIGYHLSKRLLGEGRQVIGVDNLNDYYSPELKRERLALLTPETGFQFHELNLADEAGVKTIVAGAKGVVHLAAQAGVRYSFEAPQTYNESNLTGTLNVLEACREHSPQHLVYASSSSVYGTNSKRPYSVSDDVDHPISLYAATKKANEMMAHVYAHNFELPVTGLRFFTVYGPWGRPDMAYFKFARAIMLGEEIKLYAKGLLRRDYTYIDDIIEGICRVLDKPATPDPAFDATAPDPATSSAPYRLYNIGRGQPFSTRDMLTALEKRLGREAIVEEIGMQPGEVEETWADVESLKQDVGYQPVVEFEDGIGRFADWYLERYGSSSDVPS